MRGRLLHAQRAYWMHLLEGRGLHGGPWFAWRAMVCAEGPFNARRVVVCAMGLLDAQRTHWMLGGSCILHCPLNRPLPFFSGRHLVGSVRHCCCAHSALAYLLTGKHAHARMLTLRHLLTIAHVQTLPHNRFHPHACSQLHT